MIWSLGSFGDLPKEVDEAWRMQSGVLQIWKANEDMTLRSPLVAGVWRAQVHWVD